MAGIAGFSYTPREGAQQLRAIAEQLERGQAETPLVDQADALLGPPDSSVSVVLLGLDPAARATALTWLVGPQHHSVTIKLSEPLEMLEVHLQERGYSLETESQGRSDFESAERRRRLLQIWVAPAPIWRSRSAWRWRRHHRCATCTSSSRATRPPSCATRRSSGRWSIARRC
ncbi:hypothetical protein [Accumulibacter sp.]|uniref:hypothetical protein n=1 Tax=Accumulibacter sp. TaxID=2053492 RepID=UPI0026292FD1|nr:hypothetical protein [Accumulibacter sp.]